MVAQVAGEGVGLALQLGEAQAAAGAGERRALGVLATGVAQQVVDVAVTARGELRGDMTFGSDGHRGPPQVNCCFTLRNMMSKSMVCDSL